jgi:heptosyltransferase-2
MLPVSKILIVGPAWIGDMVMAQTLFKLLKQQNPNVIIDVLSPNWCRDLLTCMPEVNRILTSPFKHGELRLRERYQFAKQFRNIYDEAIVLPRSFKSALIPFFAKIPKRTGWIGECRLGLLNNLKQFNKKKYPLMVQRFAILGTNAAEQLPEQLSYPMLQTIPFEVTNTLKRLDVKLQRPILVLCPGAEYGPAKRWPAEYFAELAREKYRQGWQIWLLGSTKDRVIAQTIQKHCDHQCADLTGKTQLLEAIHLLSVANVVISNDSGLMHIAAALQKPLLVIYGSSSAQFTPPLSNQAKILSLNLECSPCFARQCPLQHFRCMKNLSPQFVLKQLEELKGEFH